MPERLERWIAELTGDIVSSPWFDRLARFGYASRGALFGMVGVLAISRGLGSHGNAKDTPGALEALQQRPLHEGLLVLLALGLAGYALWRMVQGLLDSEGEGVGWFGLAKRAIYLGIGFFHGYLAPGSWPSLPSASCSACRARTTGFRTSRPRCSPGPVAGFAWASPASGLSWRG